MHAVAIHAAFRAVHDTGLFDTEPEEAFDRLADMAAATLLDAPHAFITVVDTSPRDWRDRDQFILTTLSQSASAELASRRALGRTSRASGRGYRCGRRRGARPDTAGEPACD